MEKNLQYGPGTRLVRGIYVTAVRFLSEFGPVMMVMLLMLNIVVATMGSNKGDDS